METNASVGSGFVDGRVGSGFDLQLIGRLDEDEAMIGNGLSVVSKEVSIDIESAGHLGRCIEGEVSLAVLKIEVARENRLAVLDDVDVGRAAGAGGEDLELEAVACFEDNSIGAEEYLVGAAPGLEGNGAGGAVAVVVIGLIWSESTLEPGLK